MKPSAKRLPGIPYLNFKDPWTSIVAESLWEHKCICCLMFKLGRTTFTNMAKYYARFKGWCNRCGAKLKGRSYKKPERKKDASFESTIDPYQLEVQHGKRQPLRGTLRQQIVSSFPHLSNGFLKIWCLSFRLFF